MKTKYFITLVFCVAALALPGCGGKGSSSTPEPPVSQPTSTTAITGLASKGPISGAVVQAFAIRNGIADTVPIGQSPTDAAGKYTIETFGYAGPVMVEVAGGSYKDEISGAEVTLKIPLRTVFSSVGTGTTTLAVTPLTELAVKKSEGSAELTAEVIDASNRSIAAFFNLTNIVTSLPSSLGAATDDQRNYAKSLGVFSQLVIDSMRAGDIAAGQSMDDALATVMTTLGNELQHTGDFSTDSRLKISLAQSLFSNGIGTTTPPPAIPPPPLPAGGVVKFSTEGTSANAITDIRMTVALPAGVLVEVAPGTNIAANISVLVAPGSAKRTLSAFVTQATPTIPGKIDIHVNDLRGIAIGQLITINFTMDPAATVFPAAASDFAVTGVAVTDVKGAPIAGISVAPLSLAAI